MQSRWIPDRLFCCSIFAAGASGGHGTGFKAKGGVGSLVRAVFHFHKGTELRFLIGQKGDDVCHVSPLNDECDRKRWDDDDHILHVGGGGGGATFVYQIDSTNLLRMSTNGQYSKGIDSSRTLLQRLQLLARSPLLIAGGGGGGGTWSNAQFSHGEPGKSFHNPFLYYSNLRNDATNDQTHAFAGTWNHTMRSPSLPVDGSPLVRLHFDLDLLESPAARLNITPNRLQQIAAESNQSASLFSGRICDDKRSTSGSIYGGFGGGSGSCLFGGGGAGYQPGFGRGKFGGTGGSSFFDSNRARFPAYSSDAWATLDNDHHPQHQLYSNAASPAPDVGHRQQLTKTQRMWPPQDNGFVLIVPQIENCCDRRYPCVFLNGELNRNPVQTMCVCSANHFERSTCVRPGSSLIIIVAVALLLLCVLSTVGVFFYFVHLKHRLIICARCPGSKVCPFGKKHRQLWPHLHWRGAALPSTDVQLSLLRNGTATGLSEFNPNYEFGSNLLGPLAQCFQDIHQIARERVLLQQRLGRGAFGEVFAGRLLDDQDQCCVHLSPEAGQAVAIKTLPEFPTYETAEIDFLTEALIMCRFNHRNVVRLLGVCFDQPPRLLILELLSGGDLKSFLRENRHTPRRISPINMGDLIVCALDVARGCQYLADNHFVHRDIAARNCLLSNRVKSLSSMLTTSPYESLIEFDDTKCTNGFNNSGIVAKIADFGMARDVYKSDYYKKGGKAMIPVKWMPPESFMDGVFCNATDVWSFGILLWEIFGFGFTPYPGKSNQEVMQYVISGGRLDRPNSATPDMIWDLTQWCWHPMPKQRPTFTEIVRQLGRCLQNKSVLNSPLPRFSANASASNSGGLGNEVHLPFRGQQSLATIQPLHHYLHPVGGVGPTSDMTDFSNGTGGTSSSLIRRSQNSATQSGNNTCSTASTLLTSVSGAPTIGQTHGTNIHQPHLSQKDANSTILQRQLVERQTLGIVKIRGQALKRLSNMLRREPNVPRFSFRYDLPSTSAPSSQSKSGNWIHRLRFSIAKSNKNHQKLPGPPSKSSVNRPPIISSSLPLPPPPTASSSSTASNARSIGNQNNKSDAILPSTSSASNRNLHDDRDFDRRRRKSSDELLLQVNQLNTNQIDRSEK